jgi:hypothetical protein
MKLRLVGCAALVAAATIVPSAGARPEAQQDFGASVAAGIVGEIAKSGVKAGVAAWAPDLVKYTDPQQYGIEQIQAQLAQLDSKLTQLGEHQLKLANQFDCVTQRTELYSVVARAQSQLESVKNALQLPTTEGRAARFDGLFRNYEQMAADQLHLHNALIGPQGVILSCARHMESGMQPYLTASLARNVHDFYATYSTAAAALLVVRAQMMALHPDQFTDNEVKGLAVRIQGYIREEEALIKPAFPNTMLYDRTSKWLWWTKPIYQGEKTQREQLQQEGWHITGHSTIPTCSAVYATLRKGTSGLGQTAVTQRSLINAPRWISCYDDHDNLRDYNLDEGREEHYGYSTAGMSLPPSLAARANDGLVAVEKFSYLGG